MLPLIVLTVTRPTLAGQGPKPDLRKKPAVLTDEERDILKNREILENLELLLDFDKFRYFDLFAEKDSKREKSPAKPVTRRNERKAK